MCKMAEIPQMVKSHMLFFAKMKIFVDDHFYDPFRTLRRRGC